MKLKQTIKRILNEEFNILNEGRDSEPVREITKDVMREIISFLRDTVQSIYVEGKIRQDVLDAIAQAFADKKITYKGKEKQDTANLSEYDINLAGETDFQSGLIVVKPIISS
jgi:hypothetical protein